MRLSLALFAGSAIASAFGTPAEKEVTLVKRDGPTVSSAIAAIQAGTTALQNAVSAFNSISDAAALQSAASSLESTIQSQTELVSAGTPLTFDEAVGLVTPITDLSNSVQSAVDATVAKKPTFDAAGVSSIVLSTLQQLRSLSSAFSDATIAQVPAGLQSTATGLAAPILASLDSGIAAFSTAASSVSTAVGTPITQSGSSSAIETTSAPATASATFTSTFAVTLTRVSSSSVASTNNTAGATLTSAPTGGVPTVGPILTSTTNPYVNATKTKSVLPTFTGAAAAHAAGLGTFALAVFAAIAAL